MPTGQTRSQLLYILVSNPHPTPAPNPKKYTKKKSLCHGPERVKVQLLTATMWCWVDALFFSNHLFFLPKAPCEPAVSDDTLGPAHRQHPDIEEPGTPAFLLQGTNTKSKFANLLWRIHLNKSGQKRWLTTKGDAPCSIETWIKENEKHSTPNCNQNFSSRHRNLAKGLLFQA